MLLLEWMSDVNDIYFNRVIINQFRERKVLPVPKWIQVDLLRVSMWKSDRISFLWLDDVEKGFLTQASLSTGAETLSQCHKRDFKIAPQLQLMLKSRRWNSMSSTDDGVRARRRKEQWRKTWRKLLHNQMSTQWTLAESSTIFLESFPSKGNHSWKWDKFETIVSLQVHWNSSWSRTAYFSHCRKKRRARWSGPIFKMESFRARES